MSTKPITYSSQIVLNLSAYPNISLYSDGFTTQAFNLRSFHELNGDLFQDYQNSVFRIIPALNYKAHQTLLEQLTFEEFDQIQIESNLKKRKHMIQNWQLHLENELSSNISLTNKLAGTPLVFSSSSFHLVHISSLKFMSLDDDNLEDLQFKLVDFPTENTVLKFNPCLNFQKLRTNVVYENDVVCISAQKQVCNRTANLFSNYWGNYYYNLKDEKDRYLHEIRDANVLASVEEQTQFRITIFHSQKQNEEILYIGDVVNINLPEQNKYLNGRKVRDLFDRVSQILDGNYQEPIAVSEQKPAFLKQSTLFPLQLPMSISRQPSNEDVLRNDSSLKPDSVDKQKSLQSGKQIVSGQSNQSINIKVSNDVQEIERYLSSELNLSFDEQNPLPYSAYWRIESEDKVGGECVWDKYYRIRHFQTGRYLEITPMKIIRLTNEVTKYTLFRFTSVQKTKLTKQITKETYFHIRHKETGYYLDSSRISIQNSSAIQGQIVCIQEPKDENVFKIRKTDYEDVWEKRFLLFFIPLLTKALGYFETSRQSKMTTMKIEDIKDRIQFYYLYHRLNQMLDIMNQFIYNRLISNIQTEQDYSFPSKSRQDIIREESIMPLLIWLLIKSFPSPFEMIDKTKSEIIADLVGERSFIYRIDAQVEQQILSSAQQQKLEDNHRKRKLLLSMKLYETLKGICHNNITNQELFINFFKHYEKNLTQRYVCDSFLSSIQKNYSLLAQLGKTNKLTSIVNLLLENQSPELLQILATSCLANDEPIFANQEFLLKTIFLEERNRKKILIPVVVKKDLNDQFQEFYIDYKSGDGQIVQTSLIDFLNNNDTNPHFFQQYSYLKQQLCLKANLCFHRNTQGRELLSKNYPYSLLLSYALDDKVNDDIRAQFCKMIRTIYIDREPFTTNPKPELVRILDPISNQIQLFLYEETKIERNGEQNYNLASLKTKLLQYIENVYKSLLDCKDIDKVYNLMTLEVIKILELLLKFQLFWETDTSLTKKGSRKKTYIMNLEKESNLHQENDIDRLITFLAFILEFDYYYFKCLQEYKIARAYIHDESVGINLLNFTTFSVFGKEKENQNNNNNNNTKKSFKIQEAEVVNDPLFKKMKSLRKVIQKYQNKTFTLRENKEDDYETLIKIQICQVFSYIMDSSQDYWIDNALSHFKNSTNGEYQYTTLLPSTILNAGEQFKHSDRIYHTQPPQFKNFDQTLKRPFIEVLLIALYFTRNPQLENQIVELIQRFVRQKKEFSQHFMNVQILEQNEQQQLYNVWIMLITNLKNNLQRSQTWINRDCDIMEQTLQELWKIDSIFQQSQIVSLKLKQQIFQHIGGYQVLSELIDKAISVIDSDIKISKIYNILNHALHIMAHFAKDNESNSILIYKSVVKRVIYYTDYNIGQVHLISSLFSEKPTLFGQTSTDEYELFLILIKQHGQYPEFLQFYDEIIKVSEHFLKDNHDIHTVVLECLTNQEWFDYMNPFVVQRYNLFFDYEPNISKYKEVYLKLIAKCMNKVPNASLINQAINCISLEELLKYMAEISEQGLQAIIKREKPSILEIQKYGWSIIRIMIESSPDQLEQLLRIDEKFFEILKKELQAINLQEHFEPSNLDYLFDSLLPVVNKFNSLLQNALMSSAEKEHKMYKFVEFFLRNLDRMFFLAPQELIHNYKRMQTIKELAFSFNIELQEHLKQNIIETVIQNEQELQIQAIKTKENEDTSSLKNFRKNFILNEDIKQMIKQESSLLSKSIWTIQAMFKQDDRPEAKDLLLTNEDIIIKILAYLQYWKANNASRENVIFILNVLSTILKDVQDDFEELTERQNLFDRMNAPQIIIVLICESDFEAQYLSTLMKLMILLLTNGNSQVQKTSYEVFLSNSSCEQLFHQFKKILNMQVLSHDGAHKLNAVENKLVCKTLKVMQLFCEGHNQDLQNYFRNQHNQKNSVDLVTFTVQLLKSFYICTANYESVLQCLETLTELVQGPCKLNQQALIKSNLIEIIVHVLEENEKMFELSQEFHRGDDSNYRLNLHPGKLSRLKFKCLNLIVSLLECTEPQDSEIMRIVRTIPLNVLTTNLTKIYSLFKKYSNEQYKDDLFDRMEDEVDDSNSPDYYELIIENGFHIYLLMQQFLDNQKAKELLYEDQEMNDVLNEFNYETSESSNAIVGLFSGIGQLGGELFNKINEKFTKTEEQLKLEQQLKEKEEQKQLTKNAIKFFRENTCSIDMIRDDRLYTIYFPRLPICNLPKNAKIEFHDSVDRTSSKTKLTALMDSAPMLIKLMQYEERLNQLFAVNPVFGFLATQGKLWEQCAFITTLLINFIVLVSYSQDLYVEGSGQSLQMARLNDPRLFLMPQLTWTLTLIQILGILMLVFSSLIVFFFVVKRAPLKVDHIWINFKWPQGFFQKVTVIMIKGIKSMFVLLQDVDILYYSIYIIAGIVGLSVHPFFFAFHLMDFLKMDQLKTILNAMWNPRVEIGLALLLLVVMEYYVGIIGYIVFYQDYPVVNSDSCNSEGAGYVVCERACSTLWQCSFTSFDYTFKYTGALGAGIQDFDTVKELTLNQDETYSSLYDKLSAAQGNYNGVDHQFLGNYLTRFAFDNIVNLMLVMILLNMLQGIIIDTFGSLREAQQERIKDQTMKCYICGITREKFEKNDNGGGFSHHIKYEHYMWNYVYYYAYLQHKDENDFNGNESYVKEKIDAKDISWLPIKRAKFAEEEQDDSNQVKEQEEQNIAMIRLLNEKCKNVQVEFGRVLDICRQNSLLQTQYKK